MTPPISHPQQDLRCLLVEDDPGFASMIRDLLSEEGFHVTLVDNLRQARGLAGVHSYELIVLDNHLPDGKGFDFYLEIAGGDPAKTVIVLTGLPELSHAVELTRRGLFDYLAKPVSRDAFIDCIRRARARLERIRIPLNADSLVATAPAMREISLALDQASRHPTATVLFTGETGSGKDAAARALHQRTHPRETAATPFVPVNCAAIPGEIFEAELFGAERGAYTGADRTREGLATAARQGTLFLDEISEIPLPLQAKLLRFLEAREYRPLGATVTRRFQARLVAATNRSLADEVAVGRFREDLLYRLDVFTVQLPPLRHRTDEIPVLAEQLLVDLAAKYVRPAPRLLQSDIDALVTYPFPGNVRELRNLLERSLLRTPHDAASLALDHLWLNRPSASNQVAITSASHAPDPLATTAQALKSQHPQVPLADDSSPDGGCRPLGPLERREYEAIREALLAAQGGIRRAAARLGITHQALLRRLEKWPELRQAATKPGPP
ncbi:MAG: sigma-54-dependent transcriptional regulator [Limisphaerales bacterium]